MQLSPSRPSQEVSSGAVLTCHCLAWRSVVNHCCLSRQARVPMQSPEGSPNLMVWERKAPASELSPPPPPTLGEVTDPMHRFTRCQQPSGKGLVIGGDHSNQVQLTTSRECRPLLTMQLTTGCIFIAYKIPELELATTCIALGTSSTLACSSPH